MFSFFKKLIPTKQVTDSGPTLIDHAIMSFEERKSIRQMIVTLSVNEVFASLGIDSSMYKYNVLPVDSRGHYFAVMIETNASFATSLELSEIEQPLKDVVASSEYKMVVDGVYWKASTRPAAFNHTDLLAKLVIPNINKEYRTDLAPLGSAD